MVFPFYLGLKIEFHFYLCLIVFFPFYLGLKTNFAFYLGMYVFSLDFI